MFDGTLGDWATEPVKLELNPDSKPFNSRCYLVPIINKAFFRKELKSLVKNGSAKTSTADPIQHAYIYYP